jgi:hypothetical protein
MSEINEYVYLFEGEEYFMSEDTANLLNYALGLNGSTERYIRIRKNK